MQHSGTKEDIIPLYHYVYKITNNKNLKNKRHPYFYIGVRTSKGKPCDDIFYNGSSVYLLEDIKKSVYDISKKISLKYLIIEK